MVRTPRWFDARMPSADDAPATAKPTTSTETFDYGPTECTRAPFNSAQRRYLEEVQLPLILKWDMPTDGDLTVWVEEIGVGMYIDKFHQSGITPRLRWVLIHVRVYLWLCLRND